MPGVAPRNRATTRGRWLGAPSIIGALGALAVIGLIHFASDGTHRVPGGGMPLVGVAALTAAIGGLRAGLLSAGVGVAYTVLVAVVNSQAGTYDARYIMRDGMFLLICPVVAVLVGLLRDRSRRAVAFAAAQSARSRRHAMRRRAHQSAAESGAKLRALFDASPFGVLVAEPESGRWLDFNRVAHEMLGYTRQEFARLSIADIEANESPEEVAAHCRRVLEQGGDDFETRLRAKGGRLVDVVVRVRVVDLGSRRAFQSVLQDVTERKASETALRESEQRFRSIVASIDDIVWMSDRSKGGLFYVSPAWETITGYPVERILADNGFWRTGIYEADREASEAAYDVFLQGRTLSFNHRYRIRRADGEVRWLHARAHAVTRDEAGKPVIFGGAVRDVTSIARAQAALEAEVAVLDLILREQPLEGILDRLARDEEAQRPGMYCSILLVNDGAGTLRHGAAPSLPREYVEAGREVPIGPEMGCCGTAAHLGTSVFVADIETDPKCAMFKDIALRHGLRACWSHPVLGKEGAVLGTFAMYFTDRRLPTPEAEQSIRRSASLAALAIERANAATNLRESEAMHRLLADNASDMIARHTPDGRILYVSPACRALLGHRPGELIGRVCSELVHPGDLERHDAAHASIPSVEVATCAYRMRRRSGDYVWVETRARAVRDAEGAFVEIVSVTRDITAQQRAEDRLRLLNRELAHRVKNNLAALLSLCDQTLRLSPRPEDFAETFRARIHAMARVQDLLRQGIEKPIDLRALTARSLEGYIAGSAPAVHVREGPDVMLPPRAASVLNMALHELATNAVKHGALSTPAGRVEVQWGVKPEGGLRVSWHESGGPAVTPPQTLGFGAELITGGVRHELGGHVEWLFEPTGVRCELVVPPAALGTDPAHGQRR